MRPFPMTPHLPWSTFHFLVDITFPLERCFIRRQDLQAYLQASITWPEVPLSSTGICWFGLRYSLRHQP
jgi:hypothetical protein